MGNSSRNRNPGKARGVKMKKAHKRILKLLEREVRFYYPWSDPTFRKCMQNAMDAQDKIIFNILKQKGGDDRSKP